MIGDRRVEEDGGGEKIKKYHIVDRSCHHCKAYIIIIKQG